MEDRYLYKAKRLDNKEWVEGNLRQDNDLETAYISGWDYYQDEYGNQREPFEYEIDPATLCQCTGLKDKNGKLIWENDIFRVNYYNWRCKVVWDSKCVRFIGRTNDNTVGIVYVDMVDKNDNSSLEIIGNIFDNPELLEV